MSAKKLDKSKPHGVVYGAGDGRVYEQDGLYFRGDGTLWSDPNGKPYPAEPKGKVVAEPKPSEPDQLTQQMGE